MAKGEIVTVFGCPGICPRRVEIHGLIPPLKKLREEFALPPTIKASVTGYAEEKDMIPIEQQQDGVTLHHNGYADEDFPICENAINGNQQPTTCPKETLIRTAVKECVEWGILGE